MRRRGSALATSRARSLCVLRVCCASDARAAERCACGCGAAARRAATAALPLLAAGDDDGNTRDRAQPQAARYDRYVALGRGGSVQTARGRPSTPGDSAETVGGSSRGVARPPEALGRRAAPSTTALGAWHRGPAVASLLAAFLPRGRRSRRARSRGRAGCRIKKHRAAEDAFPAPPQRSRSSSRRPSTRRRRRSSATWSPPTT